MKSLPEDVDVDADELIDDVIADADDADLDVADLDVAAADDDDDDDDDKEDDADGAGAALELVALDHVQSAGALVPMFRQAIDRGVRNSVSRRGRSARTQMPQIIAPIGVRPGVGATTIGNSLAHVLATDFDVDVCFLDLTGKESHVAPNSLHELVNGFVTFDDFFSEVGEREVACAALGETNDAEWYSFIRSTRFAKTLEQLRKRFGFVVVDLPSMADGRTLAAVRHLDGFLLVARHGKTSLVDIEVALNDLSDVDEVGVVLNRQIVRTPRFIRRWLRVR